MLMLRFFNSNRRWLENGKHDAKLVIAMMVSSLWVMLIVTVSVLIWAIAFLWLDIFPDMEKSVYFGLVTFTTLGFGDVLLPDEWRILGGIMAVNGLLNVGMLTTVVLETLRSIRDHQISEDS